MGRLLAWNKDTRIQGHSNLILYHNVIKAYRSFHCIFTILLTVNLFLAQLLFNDIKRKKNKHTRALFHMCFFVFHSRV